MLHHLPEQVEHNFNSMFEDVLLLPLPERVSGRLFHLFGEHCLAELSEFVSRGHAEESRVKQVVLFSELIIFALHQPDNIKIIQSKEPKTYTEIKSSYPPPPPPNPP